MLLLGAPQRASDQPVDAVGADRHVVLRCGAVGDVPGDRRAFADTSRWADLPAAELVRAAVAETVGVLRHEEFLRAVVLLSASHPESAPRFPLQSGAGDGFADVVLRAAEVITLPGIETAVRHCFSTVFAASVIRVANDPGFARPVPVEATPSSPLW